MLIQLISETATPWSTKGFAFRKLKRRHQVLTGGRKMAVTERRSLDLCASIFSRQRCWVSFLLFLSGLRLSETFLSCVTMYQSRMQKQAVGFVSTRKVYAAARSQSAHVA